MLYLGLLSMGTDLLDYFPWNRSVGLLSIDWIYWTTFYGLDLLDYVIGNAVGRIVTFSGVSNDCGSRTSPQR